MAVEMPFDIDAALDQLEKKLNQSDHEEKETEQIIPTSTLPTTSRKSVDEILLVDLDPLGNPENHDHNDDDQDSNDKLERIRHDLEELYPSSMVLNTSSVPTSSLPDLIGQKEELSSTSLPLAVEQLEFEVRQEILQHTIELSTSTFLSPDITNLGNDRYDEKRDTVVFSASSVSDEEQEEGDVGCLPENETEQISTNLSTQVEPDIIQHEAASTQTRAILHSVDSIVNAPMGSNLDDFIASSPIPNESMSLQLDSEVFFTACDDTDEKSIESTNEEPTVASSVSSSTPSQVSNKLTSSGPIQDFDLVKNVLSEMFDKSDGEILDEDPIEEKESELVDVEEPDMSPPLMDSSLTTNNNDDFRFLDEMIADMEGADTNIHQLTPAEIDRVDNLLKEIVNSHKAEAVSSSSTANELESCPTPASSLEQPPISSIDSLESSIEQPVGSGATGTTSTEPIDEELVRVEQEWAKLTDEEKMLGSVAPEWVSDDQAPLCMKCSTKFSITRRRHHCRACGKVFCAGCCWQKIKLIHDDNKEDRVCHDCIKTINHVEYLWSYMRNNQKPRSSVLRKKTGPSSLPTASGLDSSGRQGLEQKKSVTFHESVKPGVETTSSNPATAISNNIISAVKLPTNENEIDQLSLFKPETLTTEELEEKIRQLKDPNEPPIEFRIHNNLTVISKIVDNFDCYLTRNGGYCWIFSTRGLCTIAQDEIIFIFDENISNANNIITDLLIHIHQIYTDATKGSFIRHLGLSFSSNSSTFLGSSNATGFLYISDSTWQHSLFPEAPYIFGILIHRLELPITQCFPIRLLLRLGYEYQSYPWPIFNICNRDTMFSDTQNTIMSLLCDFRSFTYVLPTIRGLTISIGSQGSVSIRIPRNRHDDLMKSLEQSSPHALSFGIVSVNRQIHSKHLVTIQNSTDLQYETRLFASIDSNNEQTMIGGNFLVINASLRSRDSPSSSPLDTQHSGSFSSPNNLNAKVNSIEDGIMLQIDSDALKILKQYLKERKDYAILAKAKPINFAEQKDSNDGNIPKKSSSEQIVEFLWTDDDNEINRGVRSPIDHFPMDGIRNSRIHYAGQRSSMVRLRWTDLFFIECLLNNNESFDPTRLADSLAKAFTQALTPYIDMLVEAKYRKIGLRVTIDRENASYLAGSNGEQLPSFFLSQLDDHMVPIIMKVSDNLSRSAPTLVLELIFYLLD